MIFESHVWKKELKKELKIFKKFISTTKIQVKPPDSSYFFLKIEKFFFISAYIVRKLNESQKLSDELISTQIHVIKYPRKNKDKVLDFLSNYHTEQFFNVKQQQDSSLPCISLCNYLIHSFIFDPIFDGQEWRVVGIQVTSDRSRTKALYFISVEKYFEFIEEVIKDHIVKLSFNRDTGVIKKSRNS